MVSRCAGLRRSTAIVSLCPFTSMVKYLGLWSSTLKGPLYWFTNTIIPDENIWTVPQNLISGLRGVWDKAGQSSL